MRLNFKMMGNHAKSWRDFLLDLIFPINCQGCGREGQWLCLECFESVKLAENPYCWGCGLPNKRGEFCPGCQKDYFLDGILAATDYDDRLISRLIKLLKYNFVDSISQTLSELIIKSLARKRLFFDPYFSDCLIIPVPLHAKRERWRGYNQAALIAGHLAGYFNCDMQPRALLRVRNTSAQATLSGEERWRNVSGCFALKTGMEDLIKNRTVILVDDVVTTGATMNECVKALKQAGALQVWGLAVARG